MMHKQRRLLLVAGLLSTAVSQPLVSSWSTFGANPGRTSSVFAPVTPPASPAPTTNGTIAWIYMSSHSTWAGVAHSDVLSLLFVATADTPAELLALRDDSGEVAWSAPLVAPTNATPALDVSGRVFVTTANSVEVFDAATGAPLWVATPSANAGRVSPLVLGVSGGLLVAADDGNVSAYNATTGAVFVTYSVPGPIMSSPALAGSNFYPSWYDTVAFGAGDGCVYVTNLQPRIQPARVGCSPGMTAGVLPVYTYGTSSCAVASAGSTAGVAAWNLQLQQVSTNKAVVGTLTGVAFRDDSLAFVAAADPSAVYGLGPPGTGSIIWRTDTSVAFVTTPALGADRMLYVRTANGSAAALDSGSGRVVWTSAATVQQTAACGSAAPPPPVLQPIVTSSGMLIVPVSTCGSHGATLVAFAAAPLPVLPPVPAGSTAWSWGGDAARTGRSSGNASRTVTGVLEWAIPFGISMSGPYGVTNVAIGPTGTLYITDTVYVYALTPSSERLWTFLPPFALPTPGIPPLYVSHANVVFGLTGCVTFALAGATGAMLWYTRLPGACSGTPAAVALNELDQLLYVALSGTATLYALNASTGNVTWQVAVQDYPFTGGLTSAADMTLGASTVYVAGGGRNAAMLRAYNASTGALQASRDIQFPSNSVSFGRPLFDAVHGTVYVPSTPIAFLGPPSLLFAASAESLQLLWRFNVTLNPSKPVVLGSKPRATVLHVDNEHAFMCVRNNLTRIVIANGTADRVCPLTQWGGDMQSIPPIVGADGTVYALAQANYACSLVLVAFEPFTTPGCTVRWRAVLPYVPKMCTAAAMALSDDQSLYVLGYIPYSTQAMLFKYSSAAAVPSPPPPPPVPTVFANAWFQLQGSAARNNRAPPGNASLVPAPSIDWTLQLSPSFFPTVILINAQGFVLPALPEQMCAYDRAGVVQWCVPTCASQPFSSAIDVVWSGTVTTSNCGMPLQYLDSAYGLLLWQDAMSIGNRQQLQPNAPPILSAGVMYHTGVVHLTASYGLYIAATQLSNPDVLLWYKIWGTGRTFPVYIAMDEQLGIIVLTQPVGSGCCPGSVVAFSAANGSVLWNFYPPAYYTCYLISAPLLEPESGVTVVRMLYHNSNMLCSTYGLDTATGALLWQQPCNGASSGTLNAASLGGGVFVVFDQTVATYYLLQARNGTVTRTCSAPYSGLALIPGNSPVITTSGVAIAVFNTTTHMVAVAFVPASCSALWSLPLNGSWGIVSPLSVDPEGHLYFAAAALKRGVYPSNVVLVKLRNMVAPSSSPTASPSSSLSPGASSSTVPTATASAGSLPSVSVASSPSSRSGNGQVTVSLPAAVLGAIIGAVAGVVAGAAVVIVRWLRARQSGLPAQRTGAVSSQYTAAVDTARSYQLVAINS